MEDIPATGKPVNDDGSGQNKDGGATLSADGKVLKDTDGKEYLVADKMSANQLRKNALVADKGSAGKYKITGLTKKGKKITGGTVAYAKPYHAAGKTVSVKDTVKIAGVKFQITEISANACKGNTSITKVTIGKNVKKIGANAFSGCEKLQSITIKTTKLTKKTVGKNSFKSLHKKAIAKVPAKKQKSYKSILKACGMKGKKQKVK
ncbi:MAG: leucine-rich repeat protein [Lachnospiraceae bacterium]|nr:leucine-rich repeat protein [Lachnospiraceae bacterium]